jgi:hypothetical protein
MSTVQSSVMVLSIWPWLDATMAKNIGSWLVMNRLTDKPLPSMGGGLISKS